MNDYKVTWKYLSHLTHLKGRYVLDQYHSHGLFSRRQINDIVFLFFSENWFWDFMQIISYKDSLHEITKPVFFSEKNKKKYFKILSAAFFTFSAKR